MTIENSQDRTLMVSIRCTVYNHEPYLRQCLDGFVMQRTNFRFEAVVHDDASTDGSADIIREYAEKYPDIIKPIYETENQWSKHNGELGRIMNDACKGKYVAFCEGDDFWTDPLKLQKQVDIMEADENVSLVHTAFEIVDANSNIYREPDRKEWETLMRRSHSGRCFTDLFYANYIMTMSVTMRRNILDSDIYNNNPYKMDWHVFLCAALYGEFAYLRDVTCAYRRTPSGLMMSKFAYVRNLGMHIVSYYSNLYAHNRLEGLKKEERREINRMLAYKYWRCKMCGGFFFAMAKNHPLAYLYYAHAIAKSVAKKVANKLLP